MATPTQKPRPSAEQQRALEMLNRSPGSGCTRALWAAHGFRFAMLTGLVNDGLVDVQAETVSAGGRTTEIERVIITAAGRRAIESTTELE